MKILIIRFSSIGDIVLTTPVIRCLKLQLPEVQVHYLTKSGFKAVLQNNPYIDKLHILDKSLSETIGKLKEEKFDLVIDLHHNLRTAILKRRLGIKSFSFNKLNFKKWLLVKFKINILPKVHIVDRYLETVNSLGVKDDGGGLDYFLEKQYTLHELLPDSHLQFTGLVIGAAHATKRLPVYKLIEVCRLATHPIVLLGGKEDAERGEEIATSVGEKVYNACGKLTLDQSAFLVKMAERIITHDTGLMHIAAAFNKPIVSVWGNTVPELGMYPFRVSDSKIMEVKHLSCRPCSKIGYKKCPLGHFKCMNDQDVSQILQE
ncbi:glycosyltransferase family 9 protein [Rubrolithibacter danxiaensis]|uniref:glycosyltransferase family 9 protein n=1 Tax=Rubrolithibacter danxiaensis TaxID=3390805 RepID=UPI003BF79838